MKAWIKGLFGNSVTVQPGFGSAKPVRPGGGNLDAALRYAHELFDHGLGYYYVLCHRDPTGGEAELKPEIMWLEAQAQTLRSATLYVCAARGWSMIASSCRLGGKDKTAPLQKAVSLCERALALAPENPDVRHRYAEIVTYRPQVRDFALARKLLDGLLPVSKTPS